MQSIRPVSSDARLDDTDGFAGVHGQVNILERSEVGSLSTVKKLKLRQRVSRVLVEAIRLSQLGRMDITTLEDIGKPGEQTYDKRVCRNRFGCSNIEYTQSMRVLHSWREISIYS